MCRSIGQNAGSPCVVHMSPRRIRTLFSHHSHQFNKEKRKSRTISPYLAIHNHQSIADLAVAMDEAPSWTLDQIAGLAFGFLLLAFYLSATQIDKFVAKSQRRQLGLCEECGGLYNPTSCTRNNCPSKATSFATDGTHYDQINER